MICHRILLSSLTASFRYPNIMIREQPSLKAPPYTMIQGLIGAAMGNMDLQGVEFSYVFRYETHFEDIETIYKIEMGSTGYSYAGKAKHLLQKDIFPSFDAFKRQILYGCYLTLYVTDAEIAESFKSPVYQLLLGRSGDLAKVEEVRTVEVESVESVELYGTMYENPEYLIPGELYAFPRYYDYSEIPRIPVDIQPFSISDGKGEFLEEPKDKIKRFDLENWQFKNRRTKLPRPGFWDSELHSHIILRQF